MTRPPAPPAAPRLLAAVSLGPTELRLTWLSKPGGGLVLAFEFSAKSLRYLAMGISKACLEHTQLIAGPGKR